MKVDILEKKLAESSNRIESEKLEQLDKVVKSLIRKVLSLENQKTKLKDKSDYSAKIAEPKLPVNEKEKKTESVKTCPWTRACSTLVT